MTVMFRYLSPNASQPSGLAMLGLRPLAAGFDALLIWPNARPRT